MESSVISKKLNNLFDVNVINNYISCTFKLNSKPNITVGKDGSKTLTIDLVSLDELKKKIRKRDNISLDGITYIEYCIDWNSLFASKYGVDEIVIKGDATVTLEGNFDSLKKLTVAARNINVNSTIKTKSGFYLGASEILNLNKFSKIKCKKGCSFINGSTININDSSISIEDGRIVVNCGTLNMNGNIISDSIKIESSESNITNTNILSNNIYIRSNTLNIGNTKLESDVTDIASSKIDSKNNTLIASSEISIEDKNNDIIEGIISPRIVYNLEDISNIDSIKRKKKLQELLKLLKELNTSINEIQSLELKRFIDNQNSKPIIKVLK